MKTSQPRHKTAKEWNNRVPLMTGETRTSHRHYHWHRERRRSMNTTRTKANEWYEAALTMSSSNCCSLGEEPVCVHAATVDLTSTHHSTMCPIEKTSEMLTSSDSCVSRTRAIRIDLAIACSRAASRSILISAHDTNFHFFCFVLFLK